MENPAEEVWKVVQEWNQTFARNDAEAYFRYIHNDLTLFVASSPYRVDGKVADRAEFEWSLHKGRTRVAFFQELQPHIQVYGNTAVVTYYNRGAYGPEGQEQLQYLKETNVLVKTNGEWKIVHIHVSK